MLGVFDPVGFIALKERALMLHAVELMLIVVVPVYILTFFFAWRYRASSKNKALYMPNWQHAKIDELIWWAIPFEIVLIVGALTWGSTHELDPHQALVSDTPPITIEVVALPGSWLFIYPEQHIQTSKEIAFPVDTPVHFLITADGPMNSFWIPQLGGQIYAMTGMVTELNLIANREGNFAGLSANYSGPEFSKMKFTARATTKDSFDTWVAAQPHIEIDPYNSIVAKFMNPDAPHTHD